MRVSLEIAPRLPLWALRILSYLAEKVGFESVWLSEHYFNRSSIVAATYLLSHLRRLSVGVGVLNPYATHPVLMAQVAASLTEVSPSRVMLCVGAGDVSALEALGYFRRDPVRAVGNCVRTIRELLSGKALNGGLRLDFRAASGVPVYVAAQGPKMLELAGEVGDGVLINSANMPYLRESVSLVRSSAARTGRSVFVEAELLVSVHKDVKKALKTVKPYVAVILAGSSVGFARKLGLDEELLSRLRQLVRAGRWLEVQEAVPDDVASALSVSGDPRDFAAAVEELPIEVLDGLVLGGPIGPNPRPAIVEVHRALASVIARGARSAP
ncbi:MAG: LLM class flavin-dependent oxidoreductase [Thaumarchaeota archaeon]|nr:LLM class flavin-dependent oxidoreductase [Candidatus Calditenuaceae archaeon]MDW8187430.1 LLM class flavin-dependent oxidoreductase [Nitrososphaerota archaeon]